MLGGGYSALSSDWTPDPWYKVPEKKDCFRQDNRTLHLEWVKQHGSKGKFVKTASQLRDVDYSHTEHLMGKISSELYCSFE